MDLSSDNFEYIFQLTKVLSAECRANRQERDKMENLLKRLAKQSGVSYEQLGNQVKPKVMETYQELSNTNEIDRLTSENYEILYQIELQEYVNCKILALISEVAEHLNSIRSFVIERKLTGFQNIDNYLEEKFASGKEDLSSNQDVLRRSKECTREKLDILCHELKTLISRTDWSSIPKDSRAYVTFCKKLTQLETTYDLQLTSEEMI